MKPKKPFTPTDNLAPANPIEVEIKPMGKFVAFRIEGAMHSAIFPVTVGRARQMIREIERTIQTIKSANDG